MAANTNTQIADTQNADTQITDAQDGPIPKFLHNLFHWSFTHVEGTAKGTVDDAKVEANPVIQIAVQAATDAAKSVLMNHVGKVMNVEPTAQGIQGALIGVVDNSSAVPAEAKEPLKLLLGGLLAGTDFLSPASAVPAIKAAGAAVLDAQPLPDNQPEKSEAEAGQVETANNAAPKQDAPGGFQSGGQGAVA